MEDDKLTNYGQNNIDAIDKFISDSEGNGAYLQKTYTMVQTNSHNPIKITKESRRKCAKSLVR